ncbi:hypothetical protein MtrunA17_Chr7g0242821 [Medicago truncatula]|uniref:Uncharacterized protein n=1 Tax=Medicago truncatula TaxID=3880 RepID=A0A072UBI3_MEDTR|nr:hypothetical protein MTR_7g069190 [Medicago truncatula]RHN46495.1 hypothetical protein MtrunA17_Chr7g0242821 [Medicago truncatula]
MFKKIITSGLGELYCVFFLHYGWTLSKKAKIKEISYFPLGLFHLDFIFIRNIPIVRKLDFRLNATASLFCFTISKGRNTISPVIDCSKNFLATACNPHSLIIKPCRALNVICDKCQKVVFQMIIYDTFVICFTSYSGKAERKVIIDLLRLIHLTLPICTGIECQNIKQGPKRTKVGKSYFAWRAEILPDEIFRQARQRRVKWRAVPESWKNMTRTLCHGKQKFRQAKKDGFI